MKIIIALAALVLIGCSMTANAVLVEVTITGEVEFNQINGGSLSSAAAGDAALVSFQLDSNNFVDSLIFPTRGYSINPASFSFTAGAGTVGMPNPLPAGETPYFILRDNDPAVDGFFTGTNVDGFNNGVATDSPGIFDLFRLNFLATYGNDPLSSLDILSALGTYDLVGTTVSSFTVDDGPSNEMGIAYEQMTIVAASVPEPSTVWLVITGMLSAWQIRRRKRTSSACGDPTLS